MPKTIILYLANTTKRVCYLLGIFHCSIRNKSSENTENFSIGNNTFLLNGKPFIIKAAEIHYPRIPDPYWEHRIQMCKALGMNTICLATFCPYKYQRFVINYHCYQLGWYNIPRLKELVMKYLIILALLLVNFSCSNTNKTVGEGQSEDTMVKVPPVDGKIGCNDTLGVSNRPKYSVYPTSTEKPRFVLCNNGGWDIRLFRQGSDSHSKDDAQMETR